MAKLVDVVTFLFLPAFFACTGMRTEFGLVSGLEAWLVCGGLILLGAPTGDDEGPASGAMRHESDGLCTSLSWSRWPPT